MIDYDLFSSLIEYNKYRKKCFDNFEQPIINKDLERLLNARYSKVSRIKKRFLYLLIHSKNVYFCTFTFDNAHIDCSDRTKKDYIKHSLFKFDDKCLIIMNRDFGKNTDREHYHVILGTNNDDDILKNLYYPFRFNVERVRIDKYSFKKLSKYINKLSNHCIKDSTNRSRIYYNFKGFKFFTAIDYRHTISLLSMT